MVQKERTTIEVVRIAMESGIMARQVAEEVMEREMVAQATLTSYIVNELEMNYPKVSQLAELAGIDDIWVTDRTGNTILTNAGEGIVFDFGADPDEQAYEFMQLLQSDASQAVIQPAQARTLDGSVYKYVGVGGWSKPGIIQVGREGSALTELEQQVGVNPVITNLHNNLSDDVLFAAIISPEGKVSYATDEDYAGKGEFLNFVNQALVNQALDDQTKIVLETTFAGERVNLHLNILSNGQSFVIALSRNVLSQFLTITVVATVVGILLIVALVYYIVQRQFNRIKQLEHEMNRISQGEGDLTQSIQIQTRDEFGALGNAFNAFVGSIHAIVKEAQGATKASLGHAEQIHAQSEQTANISSEVTTSIREIASSASQQALNIEDGMVMVHNIAETIEVTNDQAQILKQTHHHIQQRQINGSQALRTLEQNMNSYQEQALNMSSNLQKLIKEMENVSEFVQLIQAISNQTSLLALNASIEAARAGEEGRGFSVVASEIRNLAEQSNAASEQIQNTMIGITSTMNRTTDEMNIVEQALNEQVNSVQETSIAFHNIENSLSDLTQLVTEIQGITSNLTENKDQLIVFMENSSAVTQQSAAGAEEMLASVEFQLEMIQNVAAQANELESTMLNLTRTVERFKT